MEIVFSRVPVALCGIIQTQFVRFPRVLVELFVLRAPCGSIALAARPQNKCSQIVPAEWHSLRSITWKIGSYVAPGGFTAFDGKAALRARKARELRLPFAHSLDADQ